MIAGWLEVCRGNRSVFMDVIYMVRILHALGEMVVCELR